MESKYTLTEENHPNRCHIIGEKKEYLEHRKKVYTETAIEAWQKNFYNKDPEYAKEQVHYFQIDLALINKELAKKHNG